MFEQCRYSRFQEVVANTNCSYILVGLGGAHSNPTISSTSLATTNQSWVMAEQRCAAVGAARHVNSHAFEPW